MTEQPAPADERCASCGVAITNREWATNWGLCETCFDMTGEP